MKIRKEYAAIMNIEVGKHYMYIGNLTEYQKGEKVEVDFVGKNNVVFHKIKDGKERCYSKDNFLKSFFRDSKYLYKWIVIAKGSETRQIYNQLKGIEDMQDYINWSDIPIEFAKAEAKYCAKDLTFICFLNKDTEIILKPTQP